MSLPHEISLLPAVSRKNNSCTPGHLLHWESKLSKDVETELVRDVGAVGFLPTDVLLRTRRKPNCLRTIGRYLHKKSSPNAQADTGGVTRFCSFSPLQGQFSREVTSLAPDAMDRSSLITSWKHERLFTPLSSGTSVGILWCDFHPWRVMTSIQESRQIPLDTQN